MGDAGTAIDKDVEVYDDELGAIDRALGQVR